MDERTVITATRFACLGLFLWSSITISWQAVITFGILVASITLLKPRQKQQESQDNQVANMSLEELVKNNPLKGKPKISLLDELSAEDIQEMEHRVVKSLTYDAENAASLDGFQTVKQNTHCIFAKNSRVWGSPSWKYNLSLEENISRLVPTFIKFTSVCLTLGLDAFLVELPADLYGTNVSTFADAFRRTLKTLSDNDPKEKHCMDRKNIDKKGWVFEFDKVTFFITTFAPFYPEPSPRYAFGAKDCYILFQPELSFAQHNIPIDTPETNWDNPKTVRDKIRVAFRDAGRMYKIRDTVFYPMCEDMIKPLTESDDIVKWWIPKEKIL